MITEGMRVPRAPRRRIESGFTLVEQVLVIVLLGCLAVVGSSMLSDGFRVAQSLQSEQSSQYEARYVIERLARELREIKRLTDGRVCVSVMEAGRVVFRRRSGNANPADAAFLDPSDCAVGTQQVAVTLSGMRLTLAYDGAEARSLTELVAASGGCPDGRAFCLSYLARDGVTPVSSVNPAALALIQIEIELLDAGSEQRLAQTLRVALRH